LAAPEAFGVRRFEMFADMQHTGTMAGDLRSA
jgi:hypothetical protein